MIWFYRSTYAVSRLAAIVAAIVLVAMVTLIAVEIGLRYFFSTSTFVLDEFVGYGIAICVIWPLGYTLEHEQLIRVNLLIARMPARTRAWLTAAVAFVACAGSAGLAWIFWVRAVRAFTRGTVSASIAAVPTWIPEGAMLIGLVLFALQLFAYGLRQLTGNPPPATVDLEAHAE